MLTDQKIRNKVFLSSAYSNGVSYQRWGCVKNIEYDRENDRFNALVKGSSNYRVSVDVNENGDIEEFSCSCPAYYEYPGICKHIVALLKEIQLGWDNYRILKGKNIRISQSTKDMFNFFNNINDEELDNNPVMISAVPNTSIRPLLCVSTSYLTTRYWLEMSIGNERLYVMRSIIGFVESMHYNRKINYGKNYVLNPSTTVFDDMSQNIYGLLKNTYLDEKALESHNYYSSSSNSSFSDERKFKLSNSNLIKFLEIMKDEAFDLSINGNKMVNCRIVEGRPDLKLEVTSAENGLRLAIDMENDEYIFLDYNSSYCYHKKTIYKVDKLFSKYSAAILKCFRDNKAPEILVPETETSAFVSSVMPEMERIANVKMDSSLTKNFYREVLEKQVYFDKYGDGIAAKINFKYGDVLINPLDVTSNKDDMIDGKSLLREIREENKVLNLFKKFSFEIENNRYIQKDQDRTYEFIKGGLDEIRELSEVFYSDEFKNISIKTSGKISAGIRVNTGTGLLEMKMEYEDIEPKELMDLLASYKLKKRYHRLKNGNFIPLDSSDFQSAAELIDQLNLTHTDITKKVIELPKYRAMYIDSLAREKEGLHIERSSNFKKMVQDVIEPQDMEFEIPEGIHGKLRDYQKTGFKWLKTLSCYGFGGILADDMGLGKTLQIITLVKSENASERKPSIVIAPTSLVYNWQEEVKKFAPNMTVTVLSGSQAARREMFVEIENSDIVVTSYGMIKRDIELYQEYKFKYCFIDEAQHIKNPNTLNAKAVKQIKAGGYFALTGTPVENTLTELWSIFDFVMPGYLLNHNKFISKFETPIVKNADKDALKELGRHIKPFILRRMKKDVLKELPVKIESKMTNEMSSEQKKLYTAYLIKAKQELEKEISSNGFENSRIKIIAILTRLRQICCHPALFVEDYKGGSGKLEMLMELLDDAISGGHRILVFSQFTSMLGLIKNELSKAKIEYHYLDGSTPAQERIELANGFNAGEKDVFLISLKAGGTGLNLTGADVVIHFDPWWNPAVEDQATDRAYRIGQKNAVQVFKLITKDTIEEKIFELQQKKKELIDSVIKPGENFLTKMTEKEIRQLFE